MDNFIAQLKDGRFSDNLSLTGSDKIEVLDLDSGKITDWVFSDLVETPLVLFALKGIEKKYDKNFLNILYYFNRSYGRTAWNGLLKVENNALYYKNELLLTGLIDNRRKYIRNNRNEMVQAIKSHHISLISKDGRDCDFSYSSNSAGVSFDSKTMALGIRWISAFGEINVVKLSVLLLSPIGSSTENVDVSLVFDNGEYIGVLKVSHPAIEDVVIHNKLDKALQARLLLAVK